MPTTVWARHKKRYSSSAVSTFEQAHCFTKDATPSLPLPPTPIGQATDSLAASLTKRIAFAAFVSYSFSFRHMPSSIVLGGSSSNTIPSFSFSRENLALCSSVKVKRGRSPANSARV